jgi:hypothetical protein
MESEEGLAAQEVRACARRVDAQNVFAVQKRIRRVALPLPLRNVQSEPTRHGQTGVASEWVAGQELSRTGQAKNCRTKFECALHKSQLFAKFRNQYFVCNENATN